MAAKLPFRDRAEAGRALARQLRTVGVDSGALILALPRGGVPVGFEIAQVIHADLDVFLVRELGVPGQEELAMGAIASGGVRILNRSLIAQLGLSPALIDQVTEREQREIARREQRYRKGRPALPIAQRTVVVTDDGMATGATMLAAARAVRMHRPERIVAAVPVAPREACEEFRRREGEIVCLAAPEPFLAVGYWYEEFPQTSDVEVCALLEHAARRRVA